MSLNSSNNEDLSGRGGGVCSLVPNKFSLCSLFPKISETQLLSLCSQFYFPFVPLFPETPGGALLTEAPVVLWCGINGIPFYFALPFGQFSHLKQVCISTKVSLSIKMQNTYQYARSKNSHRGSSFSQQFFPTFHISRYTLYLYQAYQCNGCIVFVGDFLQNLFI